MEYSPTKESHNDYILDLNKKYSVSPDKKTLNRREKINEFISTEKEIDSNMRNLAKEINKTVLNQRKKSIKMDKTVDIIVEKMKVEQKANEKAFKQEANRKSVLDIEFLPKTNLSKSPNKTGLNLRTEMFYNRVKENINKVQKKIMSKKDQIEKKELKNYQKIEVTKYSQKIINTKLKELKPIHLRADDIVKCKKNELELKKEIMKEKEEDEIIKITNPFLTSHPYNKEKFDEWLEKKNDWNKQKLSKIKEEKFRNEENEKEQIKKFFHPQIDKKSEEISKKICDKPAYLRLNDKENFLEKISKNVKVVEPPFKPDLRSTKYPNLGKTFSQTNQINRNKDKKSRNISSDQIYVTEYIVINNKVIKNKCASFDNRETNISSFNISANISQKFKNKAISIKKSIISSEEPQSFKKKESDNLYRINTQENSSCDNNKPSNVLITKKNKYILNSFIKPI